MGYPTVAMPLLSLVLDPRQAVIYTIAPIVALTAHLALKRGADRSSLKRFWFMPVVMIFGVLIGLQLFLRISAPTLLTLLAVLLVAYLIIDISGKSERGLLRNFAGPTALVCAFTAGITESAVNIASPSLLLFCLLVGLAPIAIVQVLNMCFFVGKSVQGIGLYAAGVGGTIWLSTLPLIPIAMLPMLWGTRIRERSNPARYKVWLRWFVAAMAAILVYKAASLA
jgi:uncharacterized protein